jgi:hypothetical protein
MNQIHPLEYFYDLIIGKKLDSSRNNFFHKEENDPIVFESNIKKDFIVAYDPDTNKGEKMFYSNVLGSECEQQKFIALKNLDNLLLSEKDKSIPERLQVVITIIDDLVYRVDQYETAKIYPIVKQSLESIKADIIRKFGHLLDKANKTDLAKTGFQIKLKWLGQINSLTTLFLNLNTDNANGHRFLDEDQVVIKNFLAENFYDKEGQPISLATLQTNLSNKDKQPKGKKKIDTSSLDF